MSNLTGITPTSKLKNQQLSSCSPYHTTNHQSTIIKCSLWLDWLIVVDHEILSSIFLLDDEGNNTTIGAWHVEPGG
jgi:hypothetical protein